MPDADGHDLIAELDDGDRQREVYARFGLAVYMAQVFEHGLVNLVVFVERLAGKISTADDWDDRFEALVRNTMGGLVMWSVNACTSTRPASLCVDLLSPVGTT